MLKIQAFLTEPYFPVSGSPTAPGLSKISLVCAASDVASSNDTKSWLASPYGDQSGERYQPRVVWPVKRGLRIIFELVSATG